MAVKNAYRFTIEQAGFEFEVVKLAAYDLRSTTYDVGPTPYDLRTMTYAL